MPTIASLFVGVGEVSLLGRAKTIVSGLVEVVKKLPGAGVVVRAVQKASVGAALVLALNTPANGFQNLPVALKAIVSVAGRTPVSTLQVVGQVGNMTDELATVASNIAKPGSGAVRGAIRGSIEIEQRGLKLIDEAENGRSMTTIESIAMAFNKAFLESEMGFTLVEFNITTLDYQRKDLSGLHMVQMSIEQDSVKDLIRYAGFSGFLHLNAVENILIPVLRKHLSSQMYIPAPSGTITFNQFTGSKEAAWASLKPYASIDLRDNLPAIKDLAELFNKQISLHLKPFWQQYADLQFINDEIINKVHDDDLGNYLGGMAPFKKLIIMKLCRNVGYNAFSESYQNRIATAVISEGKSDYEPYLRLVNELITYLDSI